ncbi:MAG: 50S ribosomal protein L35 [Polyangiales bacterium]
MPKMKSKRAAKKRLRVTGSGRIRRGKAGKSHLMRGKPATRLRRLRKNDMVSPQEEKRIARLLPYDF